MKIVTTTTRLDQNLKKFLHQFIIKKIFFNVIKLMKNIKNQCLPGYTFRDEFDHSNELNQGNGGQEKSIEQC